MSCSDSRPAAWVVILGLVIYTRDGGSLRADVDQAVFVQPATPGPLSIDLVRGELRLAPAGLQHSGAFAIGNRVFPIRRDTAETRLRAHSASERLTIRDGGLFFEGRAIRLRGDLRPRIVWQVVEWRGWVICLGRTSATDDAASLVPPFFATELITFRRTASTASVVWLASHPPTGVGIFILDRR